MAFDSINIPVFVLVVFLVALTTIILGMLIGLLSKNQMAASNNSILFMVVFFLIPTFSEMNQTLEEISAFIFTGVALKMVASFDDDGSPLILQDYLVLIVSAFLAVVAFMVIYRKNGFDKD